MAGVRSNSIGRGPSTAWIERLAVVCDRLELRAGPEGGGLMLLPSDGSTACQLRVRTRGERRVLPSFNRLTRMRVAIPCVRWLYRRRLIRIKKSLRAASTTMGCCAIPRESAVAGGRGGVSLGYRRRASQPGTWVAKVVINGKRVEEGIGVADDPAAATHAIPYRAAVALTLDWSVRQHDALESGATTQTRKPTVRTAVEEYSKARLARSENLSGPPKEACPVR